MNHASELQPIQQEAHRQSGGSQFWTQCDKTVMQHTAMHNTVINKEKTKNKKKNNKKKK